MCCTIIRQQKQTQKKQNLRKGGTDHRERKFRLAFKTPLIKRLNIGQTQNRKKDE